MVLAWVLALLVVVEDRKLSTEQAEALAHVLYRTTIPLDVKDAIKIVEGIMDDPARAMKEAT